MKCNLFKLIGVLLFIGFTIFSAVGAEKKLWKGFEREDFKVEGRDSILVRPENPRKDGAWIWRPAWFGAFPNADIELLKRGYYLAYYDVTYLFGSPRSMILMDRFYDEMVKRGLSKKVSLEGVSRGGAAAFNWANRNPSKVACVYADAPVCDFNSWPKKTRGTDFQSFLKEWNIKSIENFKGSPIYNFENLARSGVPVLIVAGDSDEEVPFAENGDVYRKRFFDSGGNIRFILKKGCGHHPHGLENPKEIVDFIEAAQDSVKVDSISEKLKRIEVRNGVSCSFKKFREKGIGTVAFIGGSITEMRGWKEMVSDDLSRRFPNVKFKFVYSGIASLGSTPHSYRLLNDVSDIGSADIVFLEAAVNDDTNGSSGKYAIRGYEGVIRHILRLNPNADIVCLHFPWDGFLKDGAVSKIPEIVKLHESVAEHYSLASANLANDVCDMMRDGDFDWKKFGGTHPSKFGHAIYAAAVAKIFDGSEKMDGTKIVKTLPSKMDFYSYDCGKLVAPDSQKIEIKNEWNYEKNWEPKTAGHVRSRYLKIPVLETRNSGAELSLRFKGKAIGIYCLSGPESGILEYSVDGKPYKEIDTFTKWSVDLFLPRVLIFEDELHDGDHILKIRISDKKNTLGRGNSCQIIGFCVNGE